MEGWAFLALAAGIGFSWAYGLLFGARGPLWPSRQRWMLRHARRLLRRLGDAAAVGMLLRRDAWRDLSMAIMRGPLGGPFELTAESSCALALAASCAFCAALGLVAASPLGVIAGLATVGIGVPLWASAGRRSRQAALTAEMPRVFRSLAVAMGSGETLAQAIEYVAANEEGPAQEAFARAGMRMRCGVGAKDALEALSSELEAPGMDLLTCALLISQRTGSPLKGLFRSSASLVERQGEFERALAVKTAQVRLSARIVCLLPFALLALLSVLSPDYQAGLATPVGMASVAVAIAMDAAAMLIIRHLLASVL